MPVKTRDIWKTPQATTRQAGCVVFVGAAGKDQGHSYVLERGAMVIGRDPDCDLVIDDDSVSRRHARLTVATEGIRVEDLGSTNGISYLGKRFEKAILKPGTRLGIGHCSVDLLPRSDAGALPVSDRNEFAGLKGSSLAMRRVYGLLEMLEGSDAPVLVQGETGTGKELVARALHATGLRAGKPFVVIDCGNLPANLLESELFGHRKGAFTGAVADREGAFEAAHAGTVLLDELGELPLELQPKLLRVLETGQIKRVGDSRHAPVDVRLLAATQRDLVSEVAAGRFREDLYYRVAVVRIELPPLRERREDIQVLAEHLAGGITSRKLRALPPEAIEMFMQHDWPGNVRELRNAVHRTLELGVVGLDDGRKRRRLATAPGFSAAGSLPGYYQAREEQLRDFERDYFQTLWTRSKGNLSQAARIAGLDRKTLRKFLKKYGLY